MERGEHLISVCTGGLTIPGVVLQCQSSHDDVQSAGLGGIAHQSPQLLSRYVQLYARRSIIASAQ